MAKVIKQNVILGGQEFKAGTKESDLPVDVKKMALQFLVDEKKYQAPVKSEKNELAEANARFEDSLQKLEEVEGKLTLAAEYCNEAEKDLSEASSKAVEMEGQLEDEKIRADNAETRLTELEAAIVAAGGSVVRDEDADGGKVTVETAKDEKASTDKKKK